MLCRVAVLFRRQESLSQPNNNRKMHLLFCRARALCRMGQLNWRMNCGSTFPVSIQNNAATGKILTRTIAGKIFWELEAIRVFNN